MLKQIKGLPTQNTADDSDLLIMQNPTTGKTYSITKSDLFTISSGDGSKTCTFSANGDSNGVLHWLGTQKGTAAWSNPVTAGPITVTMSSVFGGNVGAYGNVSLLTDRVAGGGVATANSPGQSIQFQLNNSLKLICNGYSIRGRNANSNEIFNWKLQTSNDANTWVDLDSVANTSLANSTWYSKNISGQTRACQYFRILSTGSDSGGANILAFDEIEFYGVLGG